MAYLNSAIQITINDDKSYTIQISGENVLSNQGSNNSKNFSDKDLTFSAMTPEDCINLLTAWLPKLGPCTSGDYDDLMAQAWNEINCD